MTQSDVKDSRTEAVQDAVVGCRESEPNAERAAGGSLAQGDPRLLEAMELIENLADELEAEIVNRYSGLRDLPKYQSEFELYMTTVNKAREFLRIVDGVD